MQRGLLGIAIASILTTGAFAADMPLKAPPIVPPVYTWTGFYAGLNGGYSWGRTSNDYFAPVLAAPGYAYSASRRMDGFSAVRLATIGNSIHDGCSASKVTSTRQGRGAPTLNSRTQR